MIKSVCSVTVWVVLFSLAAGGCAQHRSGPVVASPEASELAQKHIIVDSHIDVPFADLFDEIPLFSNL